MRRSAFFWAAGSASIWLAMHDYGLAGVLLITATWGVSEYTRG